MKRMGQLRRLSSPTPALLPVPDLRAAQSACFEILSLAVRDGQVFAALTGPQGCGKKTVLEAVLADRRDRALRCIRIIYPDKVTAALAKQIEQAAYHEAGKPENLERHVVLVIEDAHTSSPELLQCLSNLASMREPGQRVPQIILAGQPELWDRLADEAYEPLTRRLAIRAAFPPAESNADRWALVENELTRLGDMVDGVSTLRTPEGPNFHREMPSELQHGLAAIAPRSRTSSEFGGERDVPPPSEFALFPDQPSAPVKPARKTFGRFLMPLVSVFVGLVAIAFALSVFNNPNLRSDTRWLQLIPSVPLITPHSSQASAEVPIAPMPTLPARPITTLPELDPTTAPAVPLAPNKSSVTPAAVAPRVELGDTMLDPRLQNDYKDTATSDVTAARLLYERSAAAGSALAASYLARTYDAAFLSSAEGPLADPVLARFWYKRAAALRHADAAMRHKALSRK